MYLKDLNGKVGINPNASFPLSFCIL